MGGSRAEDSCGAVLLPSCSTGVPAVLLLTDLWAIQGCSDDSNTHKMLCAASCTKTALSSLYLQKLTMMLCLACISHDLSVEILLISHWSQWSRSLTSLGCCWKKAAQTYGGKLYSRARSTGSTDAAHSAAPECAAGCGQHTVTMTTVQPHWV